MFVLFVTFWWPWHGSALIQSLFLAKYLCAVIVVCEGDLYMAMEGLQWRHKDVQIDTFFWLDAVSPAKSHFRLSLSIGLLQSETLIKSWIV